MTSFLPLLGAVGNLVLLDVPKAVIEDVFR